MIRINLARKRAPAYATSAAASGGGGLSNAFRSLSQGGMKALGPVLLVIGIPAAIGIGANFAFDQYVEQRTAEMQSQLNTVGKEKDKINAKLQQIKGFEAVKDQLEQNSNIIRTKIDTIEKLVRERDFTAKSLINLASALPKDAWLLDFRDSEADYEIHGATLDAGLVTDFMTKLQKNIYFKDVQLKSTLVSDSIGNQADFVLSGRRE